MDWILSYFVWQPDPRQLIYGTYDPWLVALAVAVATFSSTMGLQASSQASTMPTANMRRLTLLAGAMALGGGVWAMHFIGMLSFKLCTTVHYNGRLTMLSILPSVAASWVALDLLGRTNVSRRELWLGGLLVGSGIGAMHYVGMAALEMAPALRYDPVIFALSIVVAVVLAVVALWVRFGVQASALGRLSGMAQSLISGSVMGLAISGMHFTGMAAARFIGQPQPGIESSLQDPAAMALSITLVSVIATVLVAGATGLSRYRQLVERLEKKGARLRAISNSALDGIIVFDGQGIIEDFNPGAQRIYGWTPLEAIGRHVADLMPPRIRVRAQADFPQFLQEFMRYVDEERDTEGWHRDERPIPIRLVVARMQLSGSQLYVAFVSDITERVRMARELQDSEAQFRTLIANIPGIYYRCRMEPGWPMVFISDAVESITGYPAGDFLGPMASIRFSDLVSKRDVARVAEIVAASVHHGRHFVLEFQLRHRDGSLRWMWGNGSVVCGKEGEVEWIDGVLLDITERRQMEEDLRLAKEKAEAAASARSTFLANMSHEIRTPMNAILGFTDVVLSGDLQADQRKRLETVHKSARSLLHLLNDILDTSKLEHGAVELESIDFSLTDLIHQLRAEQSIHAQRKQLTLTHDIDPGTGEFVRGDPHRLRQIVMNLVGNAIKFTERGSVTVQVRREAEAVHIAVRDTGIGIAPDRLPHIFDAFTQADATMSRRFGGTGLGTTISKQLTELMGGRIWAESEPGVGSTFHVRMPLPPGDATLVASTHRAPHTVRIAPMRVLIVDDVAQNLELLELLLTRQGHQVDAASDGQQALELARQHRYDIILMDVQMPVMDGLTASRALRAMEAEQGWPRTPMLALSASVLQDDRHAAMDAGMDGFATKPVEMPALMAEIARVTGRPLLPAEPGTDAPPPSVQPSELIQVQRGLDRWQNWPAYQQALLRFAREHTPPALPTTLRGEQAFQQAHRLKGLGANLGLTDIEQRAQALETWAREAPDRPLDSAWQALNDALARVIADIHRLTASQQASAADAATADLPASGLDRATLKLKLAQLQAAFRRGECLDAVLDEVRRSPDLRPLNAQLAQLMQASEDFDFDLAASLAQALIQALDDMEKPHAAL